MQFHQAIRLFAIVFIANYIINTPAIGQNSAQSTSQGVSQSGIAALEGFVKTVKSGKATFTQVVTTPGKDGAAPRSKTSSGTFEFARPNRFKFQYSKPFEQLILADGTHLWVYDADLQQAQQRKQSEAFANTPAALIASANDLGALRQHFTLESLADSDGLAWVLAKPRQADSTLSAIRIGLRGEALAKLDILDAFGQRSVVSFAPMQINPLLGEQTFKFVLPPKAELIKQ
jgi:outer membrane lipoprotein carrier protein